MSLNEANLIRRNDNVNEVAMPGKFRVGIGAVISRGDEVLLLKRSPHRDIGAGEWEPVSGRVESGESVEEAVSREVFEETGLVVDVGLPLGVFSFSRPGDLPGIGITFATRVRSGDLLLSNEHDAASWYDETSLRGLPLNSSIASVLERYFALTRLGAVM